ncbi:MAG: DHH family phosphoesterase [Nitrososphaerota archaeon]|nr:DHH family phosphoesterase [Nitrososphaerota archaeon]
MKRKDLILPVVKEKVKRIQIICHRHADVDAYCSAYALSNILKKVYKGVRVSITAPEGLSILAKRVQSSFPAKVIEEPKLFNVDLVIIVDTGNASLIEGLLTQLRASKTIKIAIDHHPLDRSISSITDYVFVDEEASATSEVIYNIAKANKLNITKKVAQALLIGILFDSQHLTIAKCRTLKVVSELCDLDASITEARKVLSIQREPSETIARLKGAQRLKIYRLGKWFFVVTHVGSFHASVARALIDLGADVSFAASYEDNYTRGSLRASNLFSLEAKIHLGLDIAKVVASELNGTGGGHPTAASLTVKGDFESTVRSILRILSSKLGEGFKEIL